MPLQYKIIMIVIIIISRNGTILSIIIIYHSKNIIIIIMAKSSSLASAESSQNPVPEREFTLPIPPHIVIFPPVCSYAELYNPPGIG
jgi:hypothetical protein